MNRTTITYPCSCEKKGEDGSPLVKKGFCEASDVNGTLSGNGTQGDNNPEQWPVYQQVRRGLWGPGAGLPLLPLPLLH